MVLKNFESNEEGWETYGIIQFIGVYMIYLVLQGIDTIYDDIFQECHQICIFFVNS